MLYGLFGQIVDNFGRSHAERSREEAEIWLCARLRGNNSQQSDAISLQQCTTFPAGKDTMLGRGGAAGESVIWRL